VLQKFHDPAVDIKDGVGQPQGHLRHRPVQITGAQNDHADCKIVMRIDFFPHDEPVQIRELRRAAKISRDDNAHVAQPDSFLALLYQIIMNRPIGKVNRYGVERVIPFGHDVRDQGIHGFRVLDSFAVGPQKNRLLVFWGLDRLQKNQPVCASFAAVLPSIRSTTPAGRQTAD